MLNTLRTLSKLKLSQMAIYLLCFSLGLTHSALAEYKKPKEQRNDAPSSQSTGIAATRTGSCTQTSNSLEKNTTATANLTTLAPHGHIGQSAATNPTFTWYIPDLKSYPIEFGIHEYDPDSNAYQNKGKQLYQTRLASSAGIMSHSLPEQVTLVPGQTYIWQVAVICNQNSPSQTLVVNNRVEIIEIDPATASELSSMQDPIIKANTYASSGFWYDAIAEVAVSPNNSQARDAAIELISQLATMEQDSLTIEPKNQETYQQNLELIIESLQ